MPFSTPDSLGSAQTTITTGAVAIAFLPGLSSGNASSNAALFPALVRPRNRRISCFSTREPVGRHPESDRFFPARPGCPCICGCCAYREQLEKYPYANLLGDGVVVVY